MGLKTTFAKTLRVVRTCRPHRVRAHCVDAMALSKLSGDEQGIILGQLRNTLEPRLVIYFSSASKELRALLTPAVQQQLRKNYEAATALCLKLCLKMGIQSCKELREATKIEWRRGWPSANAQAQPVPPTACSGWRRGWSWARYRP